MPTHGDGLPLGTSAGTWHVTLGYFGVPLTRRLRFLVETDPRMPV